MGVRIGLFLPPLGILALCSHSTRTNVKFIFRTSEVDLQAVGYGYLHDPEVDLRGLR
jgi:hypothetical protein